MVTSSASTAAFGILVAVLLAAAVGLDVGLAHARASGVVPVKASADCNSPAPASPPVPPAAVSAPTAPPGMLAAFGSCGDAEAHPATPSPIK